MLFYLYDKLALNAFNKPEKTILQASTKGYEVKGVYILL
jgi:hypothetical protein